MRTWRVGSISMGASLLFLGVLLLLTQVFHIESTAILLAWWPVILIVLGAEILLYLFFSKREKPNVKYDILSIFFIGFIGMVGIGFTVLTTTGILDKVNDWANIETKTMNLPEYEHAIEKGINRVVVDTGNHLTIENTADNDVSIFGTYRAQTVAGKSAIKSTEDYLLIKEKGDTMYVEFKEIYNLTQPFQDRAEIHATLIIPSNVKLEVNGENNAVTLKPRNISNSWSVNQVSDVNVLLTDQADILIKAENVYDLGGKEWDPEKQKDLSDEQGGNRHSGIMKVGEGKHTLTINDAEMVSVLEH